MCYFGFSAFWIVLNVLVQQVNVTEVEVSVKIEQQQISTSHDRASLTHYSPVLLFYTPPENIRKPYTPWKHQKLRVFWCFHGYIDLLPFTNVLELLVINSLSERRNIFAPLWLKVPIVLVVLQLARVRTSPQLRWITWSGLALYLALKRVPEYLWHSSEWSCRFGLDFQYTSGHDVLAYSIDTDFNNVITMLQSYVHP